MSPDGILIVEDHEDIRILLKRTLAGIAGELVFAPTGEEARKQLSARQFRLIILDISLPDADGLELFAELKAKIEAQGTPVMFLTGKKDVTHKVTAFAMGADDYIEKPFNALELRARVEGKIRKTAKQASDQKELVRGPLRLDSASQRAFITTSGGESKAVHFTPREFRVLFHLASREDHVVSRQQLLDALWGNEAEIFDRAVDSHISAIRKKLGECAHLVESVPGAGYRFTLNPTRSKAAG
jgi:two-component system phosphate regulon response regulator PhoB